MGITCCVPNCRTGFGSKLSLFLAPKDEKRRQQWATSISKEVLSQRDYVCELHFLQQDIVSEKTIDYGSWTENVKLKRKKLIPSAVPSQLLSNFNNLI